MPTINVPQLWVVYPWGVTLLSGGDCTLDAKNIGVGMAIALGNIEQRRSDDWNGIFGCAVFDVANIHWCKTMCCGLHYEGVY
jgi:hypothetical protein